MVQVTDGEEALQYCLKKPPSLIVSDVMMPNRTGPELLEALRANPATALIPVIFLSAQAGAEAKVDALLNGADDCEFSIDKSTWVAQSLIRLSSSQTSSSLSRLESFWRVSTCEWIRHSCSLTLLTDSEIVSQSPPTRQDAHRARETR